MQYIELLPKFVSSPDTDIYKSNNFIVVDFETTNVQKGHPRCPENRLVLASWYYNGTLKHHFGSEFNQEELCRDVESADFIVAHNAKFELGWLERCGIPLGSVLSYCTQIGEYTLLGNRPGRRLALDDILKRRGMGHKESLVSSLIHGGVCPSRIPKRLLAKYCDIDVMEDLSLFLVQRKELFGEGLVKVAYSRNLLTPVIVDIERTGIWISPERIDKVYEKIKKRHDELSQEYNEFTGGINRNSPKQVSEFLYSTLGFNELKDRRGNPIRTPANQPKTGDDVIGQLKATTKRQRRFLELHKEFTKVNTDYTKYIEKFKRAADNQDIIYFGLNQTITDTGRLSSTGVPPYKIQGQNIDREFKPTICSRNDGWYIAERDYSQLEFRIAVQLCKDERGAQDISERVDVHTRTAEVLTDAGQPTNRQGAKEHTFKPLFGGTSGTSAEREYYTWFKSRYPQITEVQEGWVTEAVQYKTQYIEDTGIKFYWPNCRIHPSGYISFNEAIRNAPIQYLASELVQIAVVYTWYIMKALNMDSFIINTIHDSIITELKPEERDLYDDITTWTTTEGVYNFYRELHGWDFIVPLETELTINNYWTDKEDWRDKWL